MAVQSVPGPHGTSKQPYGSFSGKKTSGPHGPGIVSVLGPYGTSKAPYASFAGKTVADASITRYKGFLKNVNRVGRLG